MIVPMDQALSTMAKYLGRNLRGTISQNMTWLRVMMPPPPTPWMLRPTNITVKLLATAHRTVPIVKKVSENMRSC